LASLGLVSAHRRLIMVRDRKRLIARANGLYGAPQAEFELLLGARSARGRSFQRPAPSNTHARA
jgi:hypothetical protein